MMNEQKVEIEWIVRDVVMLETTKPAYNEQALFIFGGSGRTRIADPYHVKVVL